MSFYNLIKSLDLSENLSKPELYSNIKIVSDYMIPNLSSVNKGELLLIIRGLKYYLENHNSKFISEYKFGNIVLKLDKEQMSIVQADPDLNMRIIAGAGSGKTTTILCRVKYILDNYTTPDRILILTFNRDSAQNIRNRVSSLFGFPIDLNIYTIDAFCFKLMNYYNYDSSIKVYSVSEYSHTGLSLMQKYGKEIASQYKYIFFDEFQDVNDVQFQILKIFTDNKCVLTVIGDDCQNIYQFRGTNNYYMINFDKIIDSKTFKLTTNYRSIASIVELANKSIVNNELKVDKTMISNNNIRTKPKFVMCENESDSIDLICKKILEAKNAGLELDRIAVLSRNSYPLKLIETEFTKREIEHVACITDKNNEDIKKILVPNKIAVTTIHKSKGLEWEVVFILGLSHEHWPEHLNCNIKNIEEERRLFYVGVTRAKTLLYLVTNHKEIPISIFISEVFDLLSYVRYRNAIRYENKELFGGSDDNSIVKESYGVTELVGMLSPDDIQELRDQGLILNCIPSQKEIIPTKSILGFIKEIKASSYEPDLGEFCDRYITRGIIINLKEEFIDTDTEYILNSKELGEKQMIEYIKKKSIKELNNQTTVRRKFTYPSNVLNSLNESYIKTKDLKLSSKSILKEIYWISLCRNFRNDRNRLAYKNIFSLIEDNLIKDFEGNNLLKQMDKLVANLSDTTYKCKINVQHKFYSNKILCSICGEIDLINTQTQNLIDLKCSENEYRLEWMVQLLLYYSLLPKKDRENIKNISVINVFTGLSYNIEIPYNYQSDKLIQFMERKIILDQSGSRPKVSIQFESKDKSVIEKKKPHLIFLNVKKNKIPLTMILDTETSDFNGDIIQFSWIIINDDNKILESNNFYIKDRLTSRDSYQVHKISVEKLRKEGKDFYFVIEKFIENLRQVNFVVGHNISYDLRCINKNLRKYDVQILESNENQSQIFDIFKNFDIICTKKLSGGKSLDSLYTQLFNEKMIDAHDSLVDVMYTYKCYTKLIDNIKLSSVVDSNNIDKK